MKFLKFNILLIIVLFTSCKEEISEVIIKGHVEGNIPFTFFYTSPVNKAAYFPFKEKITLDSLGDFEIKLPLEKARFIQILANKEDGLLKIAHAKLIIEPNKEYIVNFDLSKKTEDKIINIDGFNKNAQKLLNKLDKPGHIQAAVTPFIKDSIALNVISKIDSLKQVDVSKFETLYKKDSISKPFFDLIKLDRDYYYTAIKGTVGFIKYLTNNRKKGTFTKGFEKMWESCFENNLLNRIDFQNTEWGYAFSENYLFFKNSKAFDFDLEKLQLDMKSKSNIEYSLNLANNLLPKERLEFYKAGFLYESLIQKNYEKELITSFNDFKNEFSNSTYTKYLEPKIYEVIGFHEKIKQPLNKNINFVENYASLNKFDDVLKSLKGQKLYVDFWATWCGPCKREFNNKEELKTLLNKYGYTSLYISLDRKDEHQQWLDLIKFYNLEGKHLRVNETLKKEINEMGINSIPRYFLINEKGDIIENRAKKPSNLKALEKQLVELENKEEV